MLSKFRFIIFSALLIAVIAGCTKEPISPVHRPLTLPEDADQVIGAQNRFAFELFKQVLQRDNSTSNKLISPFSISMALGMTSNGAAGTTQKAMLRALQLENVPNELFNETNRNLITGLPEEDSKVEINIANSIWYRNKGHQPLASFLQISKDDYHAQVNSADFGNKKTVSQINNWVADATHQKIKKIIETINPTDLMFLINAIYFNGQWKYKFDADETKDQVFHAPDGAVQTPFMTQKGTFNYGRNDSFQMLELPYGTGDFNMYILMPDPSLSPAQLGSSLNVNTFNQYLSALDSVNLRLYLPKWEYDYKIKDMKPELTGLGMGVAFSPEADFSNMYPPEAGAVISKVIHKTYIKVNEKGTEAAAVTAVRMVMTTASLSEPTVKIDHPFLYLITERSTGAVLFMGIVNNPKG